MRQPKNINFESIYDIMNVLKADFSRITPEHNEGMVEIMKKADKNATVHLYRPMPERRKKLSLIDYFDSYYQQVYFSILDNQIYFSRGGPSGSGSRESHSFFINAFLENEELKKKDILTAVIVEYKKEALAYYFRKGYAYCNQDVGFNWPYESRLRDRVAASGLPYSEYSHFPRTRLKITFVNGKHKTIVYNAESKDICTQNFERAMRRDQRACARAERRARV